MYPDRLRGELPIENIVLPEELPQNHNASPVLHFLKAFLMNIVGWCVLLPTVALFSLYRKIIDVILNIKHGKLYGGLFALSDAIFFWPDVAPICLTAVLYIRSEHQIDLFDNVHKVIKEKVFSNPDLYPKLTGSKYSFGGYAYWMKYGCNPDRVLKVLKVPDSDTFNEEYLKKATAEIVETQIDQNNAVLWNFYISEKPLEDSNSDGSYCYPIIARFHHSIGDATSIVALFIRLFGDRTAQNYTEELFNKIVKAPIIKCRPNAGIKSLILIWKKWMKKAYISLDVVFLGLGRVILKSQLQTNDENALHGSNYSGKKVTVWATENKSNSLGMVKRIRKRTGSKFTCVIGTAIAASMTSYFKRNNFPVPNYTSGMTTLLLSFPKLAATKPVPLENKTAGLNVHLPSYTSMISIGSLRATAASMNAELIRSDAVISFGLLKYVLGFVPVKLIDLGYDCQTFLLTNIPGGSKIELFGGCTLERVIPIASNMKGIGISFGIISYDNKLQIGVTVDKTLVASQEEVQRIADDFFHNIQRLDVAS